MIIQAKDKEQAVFQLFRMYNLSPVIHGKDTDFLRETGALMNEYVANLRPPNPNPTKETGGRKSQKRTTRATADVDIDPQCDESEVVDNVRRSSQKDSPRMAPAQGGRLYENEARTSSDDRHIGESGVKRKRVAKAAPS